MRIAIPGTVSLFASLVFISTASAGTYIESVSSYPPQAAGKTPPVSKTWFDKGRFRAELPNNRVQIFKDKTFYTLNLSKKTYTTMNQADFDRTMQQAKDSAKALRDLLPPEARAEEEKKAAERVKTVPPEYRRTLKATTRTESTPVGTCKIWEAFVGGNKGQELCVVPLASVPNSNEYLQTLKETSSIIANSPGAAAGMNQGWDDIQTTQGFPVITRMFIPGQTIEVKVVAMRAVVATESLFAIPKDFSHTKEEPLL